MAWAKGRQAMLETSKAECLRRWPKLGLHGTVVWWNGSRVGVRIEDKNGRFIAGECSASEAWASALERLNHAG